MTWTEYFVGLAEHVKLKSKDRSFKCGAVIIGPDNEVVSTGYNSFPRGLDDDKEERHQRPAKYLWTIHAELNSILNAARIGVSTKGCVMYTTTDIPCTGCAGSIINAGISVVYCVRGGGPHTSHWVGHPEISLKMFDEANVVVKYSNFPNENIG